MALAIRDNDHSQFRELTAFFGSEYGPEAFDVPSQMKALREQLQMHGSDMDAPCTHKDEKGCWLLGELPPWNEILHEADAGLYEEDFQRLTLKLLANKLDPWFTQNNTMMAAVCLLHQVLKEHRCIQKLVMRDDDLVFVPSFSLAVIKMSLKASQGLMSLDIAFEGECDDTKRHFFDAVSEVKTLKEFYFKSLSCDSDLEAPSVCHIVKTNCERLQSVCITLGDSFEGLHIDAFFDSLSKCTALTSVELKNIQKDQSQALAKFMIENNTITALSASQCGRKFLEWVSRIVRENNTLLKLKLSGCDEDARILARALEQNTTLEYLHCTAAFVSPKDVSALACMLKVNKTLREISIGSDLLHTFPNDKAVELAEAISSNRTLTKMDLSEFVFEADSAALLIQALERNSTLSKLRVTVSPTWGDCDLSPVIEAIKSTGTCDRLEVLSCQHIPRAAPMHLASIFFTKIHISEYIELLGVELEKLFQNLRGKRFVTLLSIEYGASKDAWCQVGSFLAANNSIRTLVIDYSPGSDSAMKKFSDGLARNSSVSHIKVAGMRCIPRYDDPLRLAFGRNRSIASVDFQYYSDDHGLDCVDLLEPDYVDLSRSIVRVTPFEQIPLSKRFQAMLQRNLSLVNGAVRFVLNPTMDKMSAGLFHEFQYSPEMFRRLKEATGESDTETTRRILCAANFVEGHFFVIVGVVKTNLVCLLMGGKVLHDLNDACLRKIASYLRVSDVVP